MSNLVDVSKSIVLKARQTLNFFKTFSHYWIFQSICIEVYQKPKSNLQSFGILLQGSIMANLIDKYEIMFLRKEDIPGTLKKLFQCIGVCFKFVLKSKSNILSYVISVQRFLMPNLNGKYVFRKNKTSLDILHNCSCYTGVSVSVCFHFFQKPKWNLQNFRILLQNFIMSISPT